MESALAALAADDIVMERKEDFLEKVEWMRYLPRMEQKPLNTWGMT
jgi:hypothetical protein